MDTEGFWDHPRSRGVYVLLAQVKKHYAGSSPLARGLLVVRGPLFARHRIIPARAGFTACAWFQVVMIADHPRSRGVYLSRRRMRRMLRGSSPLARGLPHCTAPYTCSRGIIPARAGFTGGAPAESDGPGDHPRSRGVYVSSRWTSRSGRGSSPLARGLPELLRNTVSRFRIIPARAGFTSTRSVVLGGGSDHPRSRGVYRTRATATLSPQGSSPLARGLHSVGGPYGRGFRIIPARAGFTPKYR